MQPLLQTSARTAVGAAWGTPSAPATPSRARSTAMARRCARLHQDTPAGCKQGNSLPTRDTVRLPGCTISGQKIWLPFWFPSWSKTIAIGHNQQKAQTRMENA